KALAAFAAKYGAHFHRIEALSAVDGQMLVLDMQNVSVRDAVMTGKTPAIDLFSSNIAAPYAPKHSSAPAALRPPRRRSTGRVDPAVGASQRQSCDTSHMA